MLCFELFLGAYFGIRWTGRVRTADESFLRLGSRFPAIIRPLIRERDQYMAHVLRYFVDQGECVVAVVGQAHVKGICEQWEKNINVRRLLDVPQSSPLRMFMILLTFFLFVFYLVGSF